VYKDMQLWTDIRRRVLNGECSKRQIIRETGMHWSTLEKILHNPQPLGYQRKTEPSKPKLDPHLEWIKGIIKRDKSRVKKQRHTAVRIYRRLCKERDFDGGYTIVRQAVKEIKRRAKEVFMPLRHIPGEAQVDYFFALVNIGGTLKKVAFFCMALPYSDMFFIMASPRECTESFWEGHIRAFNFFGGVPTRITYDNSRVMIKQITGCHARTFTDGFLQLASHFLFEYHFCNVRRANEKGVVEGICKYARSNFLVPVPQVKDYDELNEMLAGMCWRDGERKLRGKVQTKHGLLNEECFLPIPSAKFDACRKEATRSSSLSLVRFHCNDYSVPVAFAHHELTVKGYVDRVEIFNGLKLVARHKRIWGKESVSYDPIHYLPLLERKPGALDYAQPLFDFKLPECFDILRRKLESQRGHEGTKEYIQSLLLIEKYSLGRVQKAIKKALRLPYPSSQIVKLYCMPEEKTELATFSLAGREHLKGIEVRSTNPGAYSSLTSMEGIA